MPCADNSKLCLPYKNAALRRWPYFAEFIWKFTVLGGLVTVLTIFVYERGGAPLHLSGSLVLWASTLVVPLTLAAYLGIRDQMEYRDGECVAKRSCWRIPIGQSAVSVSDISSILISEARPNDPAAGFDVRVCVDGNAGSEHRLLLSGYAMAGVRIATEWLERVANEDGRTRHGKLPVLFCDGRVAYRNGDRPYGASEATAFSRDAKTERGSLSEFYGHHAFGIAGCIFMGVVFIVLARAMRQPEAIASVSNVIVCVGTIAALLFGRVFHSMSALLREERVSFEEDVLEIQVQVQAGRIVRRRTCRIVRRDEILAVRRGTWGVLMPPSSSLQCIRIYTLTSEPIELWCGKSERDHSELVNAILAWAGLHSETIGRAPSVAGTHASARPKAVM